MITGNQTIIYDVEKNVETRLPDIPNGVKVTNPFDGTATLLPLSPPDYTPEVLVCGGSNISDQTPPEDLSAKDPASDQCSRMTLTLAGIKKGWQVERLPETRILLEFVLLPNGQVLVINGGRTGYAALAGDGFGVRDPNGGSNADNPVFTPSLYTPEAPIGHRISNADLPASNIPRMYHSSVTLTPQGNILIAGSNPNQNPVNASSGEDFPTEYRVEYLNPPYMTVPRPKLANIPKTIPFNQKFTIDVTIPRNLKASSLKVALIDLGFSSHAFHSSARVVFLNAHLSHNNQVLTIESPPNNRIYPPGPGYLYLTVDDVTSPGVKVMIGSGASPPVPDQGREL